MLPPRSSLALELGRRLLRRIYECLMTTETINKDFALFSLLPKKASYRYDDDGLIV